MQEPKRLTVYAGALAPEAFVLEIRWDDAPVDLRTVTAASLHSSGPEPELAIEWPHALPGKIHALRRSGLT